MANTNTKIEWTDATLNAVRGCRPISPGCAHCYASRQAIRQSGPGKHYEGLVRLGPGGGKWTGKISLDEKALEQPRKWKKGRRIFLNSMSDILHEDVPLEFIQRQFAVMNETPQHTYQVLTKRADRLDLLKDNVRFTPNIWMGVSVESQDYVWRIVELAKTDAAIKFVSAEPLLGPLDLSAVIDNIDWLIVGGESGPGARPMDLDWARSLRDQCIKAGVALFIKQLGGVVHKRGGGEAVLDGVLWRDFPAQHSNN